MQDQDLLVNHHFRGLGNPSVVYNADNHLQVLFQMHASVWTRVLPFCILNCIFGTIIYFYDRRYDIDFFSISDSGHVFMSLMVSYLTISRLSNSLNRYMDARKYLSQLMRSSRELIQQTIAFTRYGENGGKVGMDWRVDVSKRLVSLLRVIVSNLQRASTGKNVWEQRGLTKLEIKAIVLAVGKSNERAPYVLNIFLRSVIASHGKRLVKELEVVQELQLLKFSSDIISAYERIMKDINTPYPFPLVQMTRTFLFVYVFSLPLALLNDIGKLLPLLFVIFFLTYGFLGLELVSIEMDDPYGDDDNDFNVKGLAAVLYNDIAVYLYDIDGKEAVDRVRRVVSDSVKKASPDDSEGNRNGNGTKAKMNHNTKSQKAKDQTRRSIFFGSPTTIPETTTFPAPQAPKPSLPVHNKPIPHPDRNPMKQQSKKTFGDISRQGQYSAKRNEKDLAKREIKPITMEKLTTFERNTSLNDQRTQGKLLDDVGRMPSEGEVIVLSPSSLEEEKLTYKPSKSRSQAKFQCSRLSTLSYTSDASDNSYLITASNRSGIELSSEDSTESSEMIDEHNDENEMDKLDDDLSMSGSESSLDGISFKQVKSTPEICYKLSNDSNASTQKSDLVNESINLSDKSTSLSDSSRLINTLTSTKCSSPNDTVGSSRKTPNPKMSLCTAQNFGTRQLGNLGISSSESASLIAESKSESPQKYEQV